MRSKREKRLRAIRRDLVQPLCDKKDEAKFAVLEAALAAPKLPVKPSPFASSSSSSAMDTTTITTTTTTTTDTQIGMSSFVRFLFSTMIYSVFGFFFSLVDYLGSTRNSYGFGIKF